MKIFREIAKNTGKLLPHHLVSSWLIDYQRPNDKIAYLKSQGYLKSVKKGLYYAGPELTEKKPEPFLVANHIMGPSYVSTESALSYYGLIPEKVHEITSMTTKPSRTFETSLGRFSYRYLPLPYYSFGLRMLQLSSNQFAILASAEKAICDKIVTTSGISFRSAQNAYDFLVGNMRIDEDSLKTMDLESIKLWLPDAPKAKSLSMTIRMIEKL
ncbi:MAG: type IV toxin-antitoxin system AbiEi family antitoxin domain-containing protein [Cecembia sp.]